MEGNRGFNFIRQFNFNQNKTRDVNIVPERRTRLKKLRFWLKQGSLCTRPNVGKIVLLEFNYLQDFKFAFKPGRIGVRRNSIETPSLKTVKVPVYREVWQVATLQFCSRVESRGQRTDLGLFFGGELRL